MDAEQVKIATTLAVPFVKELIEKYISPKVKDMISRKGVSIKMTAHSFENQFEKCIKNAYNKHSFVNVLVLGNQQRKLKDIYIPLEVVQESRKDVKYLIDGFNDDFIPTYKKVLITDKAGMGKSTISKKIFLSAVEQKVGIPMLIELRRLSSSKKIIGEIFRQLSLINEQVDESFVLELIQQGGFVFILDGFDEIEKDERKFVVEDIINFIDKAELNYFVLTSRPEDALGAFGSFMDFSIRNLLVSEAYSLLRKYDNDGETSNLLIKKLAEKENESVTEFLSNPLLVSLLFAAFEAKHTVPLKKYMFYRQVYDAFFEKHDLTKGDSYTRSKHTGLDSSGFHRVLRYIGYHCTRIDKIEFGKDEIIKVVENAKDFCIGISFEANDFLKDILTKVPLFIQDGLYYKWAHKSIQEYFSACFIDVDAKDKQGAILLAIAKNQEPRHQNLLDIYYSLDYKTFRRYIIYDFLKEYIIFLREVKDIWPNITDALASKLFGEKLIFIKHVTSVPRESMFGDTIAKVREHHAIPNGTGAYMVFFDKQIKYDFIKVISIPYSYTGMPHFLFDKKESFMHIKLDREDNRGWDDEGNYIIEDEDFVEGSSYDLRYLGMEENSLYALRGKESDEIFKRIDINGLVDTFIFPSFYINSNEALTLISSIEAEITREQSADFLITGL